MFRIEFFDQIFNHASKFSEKIAKILEEFVNFCKIWRIFRQNHHLFLQIGQNSVLCIENLKIFEIAFIENFENL